MSAGRHCRRPALGRSPPRAKIGCIGEQAAADAGEGSSTQGSRLVARRDFNRRIECISQELYEPHVLRHAAVNSQCSGLCRAGGNPPIFKHGLGEVMRLECNTFQCCPHKISSGRLERQTVDAAA